MSFDFSTLVTDRTQADVSRVKQIAEKIKNGTASESELAEFNSAAMKGAYNHTDLNRVTAAMESLKAKLNGYGYNVPGYQRIKVPHVLPNPEPTSRLPEGYLELTYIESTGTQYIDTGCNPNQNYRIVVDTEPIAASTHNAPFGARSSGSVQFFSYLDNGSLTGKWNGRWGANNYPSSVLGNIGRTIMELSASGFTVGGVTTPVTAATFSIAYPVYLFGLNNSGATQYRYKGRIYSCLLYDNGTLIRDYVPCINPSGDVGLFDVANQQFYGNAGTGSFVAGAILRELPEGYMQVEYIQSDGLQYIDTKFKPNNNTRVVMDAELLGTGSVSLFGARNSAVLKNYAILSLSTYIRSDYNTEYSQQFSVNVNTRRVYYKNKETTTVDGTKQSYTNATFQTDNTMFLFATNENGSARFQSSTKLYYCQVYDNGLLIRDFVPCKNASGVFGLYDLANDVFYQNAGSGTFAAGNEVAAPVAAALFVASVVDKTEYDPHTWYDFDWPTPETMTIYLLNVAAIRSVLAVLKSTPKAPSDAVGFMVQEANDIEVILLDVYAQLLIMPTTFVACGEALCGGDNL